MNRGLLLGVAVFIAVVGIALLGGIARRWLATARTDVAAVTVWLPVAAWLPAVACRLITGALVWWRAADQLLVIACSSAGCSVIAAPAVRVMLPRSRAAVAWALPIRWRAAA